MPRARVEHVDVRDFGADTTEELADVLGTLIADLKSKGIIAL